MEETSTSRLDSLNHNRTSFIFLLGLKKALDVVYALDMSRDLSPNLLEKLKTFAVNSLSTYKISPKDVHVSLLQYPGNSPTVLQTLDDGTNYMELVNIIRQISPVPGNRNINDVIQTVINDAFSRNRGARLQTPKVLVLTLTEGKQPLDKKELSNALKSLTDRGIEYVIVYMGQRDKPMLDEVLDNPNQIVVIDTDQPNTNIGDVEKELGKIGAGKKNG